MTLAAYDLRKRAGPRRRPGAGSRWRKWTPGEIRLAGCVVYGVVLAIAVFGVEPRAAERMFAAWLDRPPQVERCDSSVRPVERPRDRCVRW